MKDKEVPQDDANMLQGKFKEPVYSLDESGNYTTVKSVGWAPKNAVMQQAWDNINEKVEQTRQKVIRGELSPLAYFMEKNMMDTKLLAQYMGFWNLTVKKHLKPKNFYKLSEEIISKYADVLDITPEELKDSKLKKKEG
ncbi:MAG TPA: hypothetical protein VIN10_02265 [Bacteroidales bacterium]